MEDYIYGRSRIECPKVVETLNILCQKLASDPTSSLVRTGKNKYYHKLDYAEEEEAKIDLRKREGKHWECGLHPRAGYFSSIRLLTNQMMLNVSVTTTAFYNRGPMSNLLEDYFRRDLNYLSELDVRDLNALVRTLQVRHTYEPIDHIKSPNKRAG